jgi:transcriptional regulator with XRE-family HTH domain
MKGKPKAKPAGRTMKQLRLSKGMGQKDMADFLGVSRNTIAAIESGKKPLYKKLAAAVELRFKVPRQWVIDNDISKPIPTLPKAAAAALDREWLCGRVTELYKSSTAARLFKHDERSYQKHLRDFQSCAKAGDVREMEAHLLRFQMGRLAAAVWSATNDGKRLLFDFKMERVLTSLESEFGHREGSLASLGTLLLMLDTWNFGGKYRGPKSFTA